MPLHNYRCPKCGKIEYDCWNPPVCCEKSMEIAWAGFYKRTPFRQFTTKHVNGTPMTISSLAELRKIEKQYNVNFPAYGGSLDPAQKGINQSTWEDAEGHTRHD